MKPTTDQRRSYDMTKQEDRDALQAEVDSYWPAPVTNSLISGAMESGVDLHLVGRFGGFGGCIFFACRSFEEAKKEAMKMKDGASVFIMKIENLGYVTPEGEVIK